MHVAAAPVAAPAAPSSADLQRETHVQEGEPTAARVHCRNVSTLARLHPLPGDAHISFREDGHIYTAWGAPVQRSCTRVLGEYFDYFDPVENTNTYYEQWKANPQHRYHAQIQRVLAAVGSDEQAKAAIRDSWAALGVDAARLGTAVHLHCEYTLNDEAPPTNDNILAEKVRSSLASRPTR